jgi:hypothetical protein
MTPEAAAIYSPCFCSGIGTLTGLVVEGCIRTNSQLPVILGSSIGGGIGFIVCAILCIKLPGDLKVHNIPVARAVPVVQNVYVIYDTGAPKNDVPHF